MSKPTTTSRAFTKIATTNPDYESGSYQLDHDANFDAIDAALALVSYAASGAITNKEGCAIITKSSAAGVMTLAAPTAGTDDGKKLTVWSATAQAHTITTAAAGINGNKNVATFGGAIQDKAVLRAYNGKWYLDAVESINITLSGS